MDRHITPANELKENTSHFAGRLSNKLLLLLKKKRERGVVHYYQFILDSKVLVLNIITLIARINRYKCI